MRECAGNEVTRTGGRGHVGADGMGGYVVGCGEGGGEGFAGRFGGGGGVVEDEVAAFAGEVGGYACADACVALDSTLG